MKIKKFNEDIDFSKIGENLFNSYEIIKDVLSPLDKYGKSNIYYQLFLDNDGYPMAVGTFHNKNFSDKIWDVVSKNYGYINGGGGKISYNDKIFTLGIKIDVSYSFGEVIARESQRIGRYYSTFDYDLLNIISDILVVKQVVEDEGYTLTISMENVPSVQVSNKNISLLILSNKYK